MEQLTEPFARLVSIDAWRNGDGWVWNDSREIVTYKPEGEFRKVLADNKPRSLLAFLRREGHLTAHSAGRVRIDYAGSDPDYITIEDRHTGEPLIALIVRWDLDSEPTSEEIRAGQTELIAGFAKSLETK